MPTKIEAREYSRMSSLRKVLLSLTLLVGCLAAPMTDLEAQNRNEWSSFSALTAVQDMSFDSSGTLWVATTGGVVSQRSGDTIDVIRNTEGLARLNASAVGIDPLTGDLFVGSSDGSISIRKKGGEWIYSMEIASSIEYALKKINGFRFRGNTVYILTSFGVATYNDANNTFVESYLRFGSPPVAAEVNDLLIWDGRIWLATAAGLASAPEDARDLPFPPAWRLEPVGSDSVLSLAVVDGKLNVGTTSGAYVRNGDADFTQRADLPGRRTTFAYVDDQVIAASGATLYRHAGGSFSSAITAASDITALAIARDGRIAVGIANQGFAFLETDSLRLRTLNAPASNDFKDLTIAADSAIWAAGGPGAVSRLKDGEWTSFTRYNTPTLGDADVWNIGTGDGNSIYAGQFGSGFVHISPDDRGGYALTRYNAANSPIRGKDCDTQFVVGARSQVDGNGRTWMVCYYPTRACAFMMVKLRGEEQGRDGSAFESYLMDPRLDRQRIYRWLVIDQNGTKWLGADLSNFERPGLLYFNERGTISSIGDDYMGAVTTDNGLPDNLQTALAVDVDNQIWVGTPKGLAVLTNPYGVVFERNAPSVRTIRLVGDLPVNAIAVDALNRKWIGTGQGVFVLSADGTELVDRFTTENSPLVSDNVLSILAVNATGDIYIGTDNGMSKISTPAVEASSSSTLSVSPQPFVVPASEPLRITGLPSGATVKILSLSGGLVKEFDSPGGSVAFWDGRDQHGNFVPSGVYIVAGADKLGDTTVLGKVAVIQR